MSKDDVKKLPDLPNDFFQYPGASYADFEFRWLSMNGNEDSKRVGKDVHCPALVRDHKSAKKLGQTKTIQNFDEVRDILCSSSAVSIACEAVSKDEDELRFIDDNRALKTKKFWIWIVSVIIIAIVLGAIFFVIRKRQDIYKSYMSKHSQSQLDEDFQYGKNAARPTSCLD